MTQALSRDSYRIALAGLALTTALASAELAVARLPSPIDPTTDFPAHSPAKVELGKLLFYDKILSGNQNIACASCHHALAFTSDGLSLPVGEGGNGLGIARNTGNGADAVHARVPRNAPHLFNAGAYEFREIFWDGRAEQCSDDAGSRCHCDHDATNGFCSPAGSQLPVGLESVLAVQAMFPVQSPEEMAGQVDENMVADAAAAGNLAGAGGVWELLALRVQAVDAYLPHFQAAYPGEVDESGDITMVHIANAIAAFEDVAFRTTNSPFDRFLRGDRRAMSYSAQAGARLFYGKAGCAQCHSGPLQTDHDYHALAIPQIGPGKGDTAPAGDAYADFGREQVTGDPADRYRFRTPSLRNVVLTGPWGHDGAYDSLQAMVRHHLDPVASLNAYDPSQAVLPSDPALDAIDLVTHRAQVNRDEMAAYVDPMLQQVVLTDQEIGLLIDFLQALTDPAAQDLRDTVPASVPSGLPIAD